MKTWKERRILRERRREAAVLGAVHMGYRLASDIQAYLGYPVLVELGTLDVAKLVQLDYEERDWTVEPPQHVRRSLADALVQENEELRTALARYTAAAETMLGVDGFCLACCGNQHQACVGGTCRCPQTGPCNSQALNQSMVTHRTCEKAFERGAGPVCHRCWPVLNRRRSA